MPGREDEEVSKDVIDILDDPNGSFDVDFREYDNWEFMVGNTYYDHDYRPFNPSTGVSADGILDFMLIYWKDSSITAESDVGGYASLGFSGTITKDGIDIQSENGVLGFKAQDFGSENVIWITAHEIGHHQFGYIDQNNAASHFNGRDDNYGNLQKFGLMTTGEGHQFSAYERYRLGWLDPITVSSNTNSVTLNETHIGNNNNAIIIPVTINQATGEMEEYFLLENYHSTNAYSGANPFLTKNLLNHTITKGIIVYHVSLEDVNWPTLSQVDIETAEGLFDWDVVQGGSTPYDRLDDLIAKGESNERTGFDERGNITATAGTVTYTNYLALTPETDPDPYEKEKRRYDSNDWPGDQEDLFSLDYNNVFTRWSNPSSRKDNLYPGDTGFEIVSYNSNTHQYTLNIAVNSTGMESFVPSKPQNLQVAWDGDHPKLTWETNEEPDMQSYKISKMVEGQTGWAVITVPHNSSLTTQTWSDVNVDKPGKFDPIYTIHYKIRAYDTQSKYSVYSEEKEIDATTNYLWKKHEDLAEEELVITEYSLNQNYPNPFNPVTTISYQLQKKGQVALKIYNALGKEVRELVNNYQGEGNYTIKFDGSDLPSGVYFYKLTAGTYTDTKKLILMK